jgi:hypothetical protein
VFFIDGIDLTDYADLASVQSRLLGCGYPHVFVAKLYQGRRVRQEILAARAADPGARIVLIGYSAGTLVARNLVHELHEQDGIDVDVLIYLSGGFLGDNEQTRPPFVSRVVHIRTTGWPVPGRSVSGADNYRLMDVWHFGSPTHPITLGVLHEEIDRMSRWATVVPSTPATPTPAPYGQTSPVASKP